MLGVRLDARRRVLKEVVVVVVVGGGGGVGGVGVEGVRCDVRCWW